MNNILHLTRKSICLCRQTVCSVSLLGLMLLSASGHSAAAMRVGMEVNSAFSGAAAAIEYQTPTGSLLRAVAPVEGDGIKLSWRSLLSANSFNFYAGPEVLTARNTQNLTGYAGYGFSYELASGPARFALHATVGLGDGPSVAANNAYVVPLGINNVRVTNVTSLSMSLAF